MLITVTIGLLVFASSTLIDFANTRYILAVSDNKAYRAGVWSVLQWLSGLVGFLVAIKITLWMLPIEMCGLYVGTVISLRTSRGRGLFSKHDLQRRDQNQVPCMPAQYSGSAEPRDKRITGFTPPVSRGD